MTDQDDAPTAPGSPEHGSFLPSRHRSNGMFTPIPVDWTVLGDDEAAEELDLLADWVEWVVWRYRLDSRTVPECWAQHGALVEELSALRTAWVQAFASTSTGTAPLDWHQSFAYTRQHLADWVARTGCRPREHRDSQ